MLASLQLDHVLVAGARAHRKKLRRGCMTFQFVFASERGRTLNRLIASPSLLLLLWWILSVHILHGWICRSECRRNLLVSADRRWRVPDLWRWRLVFLDVNLKLAARRLLELIIRFFLQLYSDDGVCHRLAIEEAARGLRDGNTAFRLNWKVKFFGVQLDSLLQLVTCSLRLLAQLQRHFVIWKSHAVALLD